MDRQIQPPYQGRRDIERRPPSRGMQSLMPRPRFTPQVCSLCGSRSIRPFSSIYGRGTTFYTRIKGLIFKHGYERTKRQSVMAANCRPPAEVSWAPAILIGLAFGGARWGAANLSHFAAQFELAAYYLGWVGLLLAVVAGVNNWGFYPVRMDTWGRKFLCDRCGGCTIMNK